MYEDVPTKGNLLEAKKSLTFARKGYTLLDQKRTVLLREAGVLQERIKALRAEAAVKQTLAEAAVLHARMEMGTSAFAEAERVTAGIPELHKTTASFDKAVVCKKEWMKIKKRLTEMEETHRSLAEQINKVSKRANALDNIIIPKLTNRVKYIGDYLEECERDEFIRLKKRLRRL
jgi:V/A-type H+-transporting ATPase subunit D